MANRELSARAQKAFEFAQEATKQLITLSSAIFTVTLTFVKDIGTNQTASTTWLHFAWASYLLSTLCGVFTLLALSGNLERPQQAGVDSIYSPNIKIFSIGQALLFVMGLSLTLVFGIKAT